MPIPKLHAYQEETIRFMLSRGAAGLLIDPGLGKTLCALTAFDLLRKSGTVRRGLVVAPLRVCYQTWPAEIAKWGFDFSFSVLHGAKKFNEFGKLTELAIINVEGLEWLCDQDLEGFDALIVDECSKFKHQNTRRFKLLKKILPLFKRRYILTGSPAPNGLLDLFGQAYLLDFGAALGKYITHYRAEYFQPDGPYNWKLQEGAEDRIYKALRPLVIRQEAADHLDLPELVNDVRLVELPPEARSLYKTFAKELVHLFDTGDRMLAVNGGARSSKLCQIANGAVYDEDGAVHRIHSAKAEAAREIVDELQGSPALIAYQFEHDLAALAEVFPDAPHIGGGVSMAKTAEILELWKLGKLPVLLVQSASVAHGLNLQEGPGHHLIWFGLTWDWEVTDQLIKRLHRQGQKSKRVIVHWLIAKGTIDQINILPALNEKERDQKRLLDALKRHVVDAG